MSDGRIQQLGGHGVDIGLTSTRTTPTVFWSQQGNSYIIVAGADTYNRCWKTANDEQVALFSINGIGEIRWAVTTDHPYLEELDAVEHFALTFVPWEQRDAQPVAEVAAPLLTDEEMAALNRQATLHLGSEMKVIPIEKKEDTRRFVERTLLGGEKTHRLTYKQWMRLVNKACSQISGLTTDDLGDFESYAAWDMATLPYDAAVQCLEANDYPFDTEM